MALTSSLSWYEGSCVSRSDLPPAPAERESRRRNGSKSRDGCGRGVRQGRRDGKGGGGWWGWRRRAVGVCTYFDGRSKAEVKKKRSKTAVKNSEPKTPVEKAGRKGRSKTAVKNSGHIRRPRAPGRRPSRPARRRPIFDHWRYLTTGDI